MHWRLSTGRFRFKDQESRDRQPHREAGYRGCFLDSPLRMSFGKQTVNIAPLALLSAD